jgi:peptidyl-prolyl cis-trans isomerase B (cyclophilin B)
MVTWEARVASSSTRQRKLARAKFDRQQARRAERLRRQRQIRAAAAGLLSVVVVIVGGMWLGGFFDKKPAAPEGQGSDCTWATQNIAANDKLTDEGTPAIDVTNFGTSTMTLALGTGNLTAKLNHNVGQCGIASLSYLAGKGYYNGTKCFELTNADGQYALRCGDKSETGIGGAAYTFPLENIPPATDPAATATPSAAPSASPSATEYVRYKRGTVVMASGTSGSQFLIFFKDSTTATNYSIIGEITSGLDILDKIVAAGVTANSAGVQTKPKEDVVVQTLSVTPDAAPASNTPTPSAS